MNATKKTWARLFAVCVALQWGAIHEASAHHSPSAYDMRQVVTINGTLKSFHWANPHVYVYIEEKTASGETVEWEIECGPTGLMRRIGWTKDALKVGDTLSIRGFPSKNQKSRSLFPNLIQRGATTLFSFEQFGKIQAPTDVAKASGLAGTWSTAVNPRTLLVAASPPPAKLTAKGAAALKAFDERTAPSANCIALPAPAAIVMPELKRIDVRDGTIFIETEQDGTFRTIHMNQKGHENVPLSLQGHSIGQWEGNTLVIETARFAPHGAGNGGGNGIPALPSGDKKRLIERFALNDDGKSLTYRFELTDADYLLEPKIGEVQLSYDPRATFEVEKCDLDVAHKFLNH